MKTLIKLFIVSFIAMISLTAFKKSSEPASNNQKILKAPESIVYDAAHKRYLLSTNQNGDIIQIDSTGKQEYFVKNKNAVQGLEIVGNVVYVGARSSIRGFDLNTGEMVMNIPVADVSNLNDVTSDDKGNLYAGDVFGTKIIKIDIKKKSYSVFVNGQGIDHPNGIIFDKPNNRILVCSYRKNSPIQAINLADSTVSTLTTTNISMCDGIAIDKYGRCYVTSWETFSIYRFNSTFSESPELFYKNPNGPADISYDKIHDELNIPLMFSNSYEVILILPILPPKKQ